MVEVDHGRGVHGWKWTAAPVLISLTKTKTKIVVNENTLESLTKTKIETKILAKTIKKR